MTLRVVTGLDMFIENVARFTEALGVEAAPIVMHLSLVAWPDSDTRDQFILDFTGINPRAGD
jgi:hypothetical protein